MGVTDLEPLVDVLRREWGADDVRLVRVTPLSAGASRLTSLVDVVADGAAVALVLQRERPGSVGGSLNVEARLLRAAYAGGVPVPRWSR